MWSFAGVPRRRWTPARSRRIVTSRTSLLAKDLRDDLSKIVSSGTVRAVSSYADIAPRRDARGRRLPREASTPSKSPAF